MWSVQHQLRFCWGKAWLTSTPRGTQGGGGHMPLSERAFLHQNLRFVGDLLHNWLSVCGVSGAGEGNPWSRTQKEKGGHRQHPLLGYFSNCRGLEATVWEIIPGSKNEGSPRFGVPGFKSAAQGWALCATGWGGRCAPSAPDVPAQKPPGVA